MKPRYYVDEAIATITEFDIAEAAAEYAAFHEISEDDVLVDRNYRAGIVVGFRLSADVDGRSRGLDERYGEW